MINIRQEETKFEKDDLKLRRKIIEIPIIDELQQDCYAYYAIDSPSELKKMLLEEVANTIDEIIINDAPKRVNMNWLKNKLNKIKVIDYGD